MLLTKLITQYLQQQSKNVLPSLYRYYFVDKKFYRCRISHENINQILKHTGALEITDIIDDTRKKNTHTILVLNQLSKSFFVEMLKPMQGDTPTTITHLRKKIAPTRCLCTDEKNLKEFFTYQTKIHNTAQINGVHTLEPNLLFLVSDHLDQTVGQLCSIMLAQPSQKMDLIGITGTNGKTTLASFFYYSWRKCDIPAAMIGTLGCRYFEMNQASKKICEQHLNTGYTTPRPMQLQQLLAQLLRKGIRKIALEVSSEALALGRVEGCHFHTAIFINLSPEHLNAHGTMHAYYTAKKQLFYQTQKSRGRFIIDISSKWGEKLAQEFCNYPQIRILNKNITQSLQKVYPTLFNRKNNNDNYDLDKMIAQTANDNVARKLFFHKTNRRHYALMLLADDFVAKTSLALKSQLRRMLEAIPTVAGRFEVVQTLDICEQNQIIGVVDYAHTPAALEDVLTQAKNYAQYVICVFGCGGNRDAKKRSSMGRVAAKLVDAIIVCDDNPRYEDPVKIRHNILEGIQSNKQLQVMEVGDRKQAIIKSVSLAVAKAKKYSRQQKSKKIIIVLAGKGHESEQIIQGEKIPFCDRAHLSQALCKYKSFSP